MKLSLIKKMALLLVGSLAFSTGAFAYTAGQIEGTTGTGIAKDPIKVNTFAEFKAAMENNEIEYVELGDVNGEDGYVIPSPGEASVDVNGVNYHPQGIVVRTPKKLNLAGKASFTQTAKAYGFILVGSEVEIYGNGSITYLILTGGDYYANAVFNVAPNGILYVKSGTIEAKNHPTFGSGLYCYAIRANSKNTLVIIDGGVFKGENAVGSVEVGNGNGVIRGGRFEDSRINYGGYVSAYDGVTCVTGGTFSSFCSTIYVPEKSIIKNSAGNELSRRECFSEEISVESPVRHLLNLKSTDGGSARIIAPAETYGDGERIFLKAAADDGYVFTGWKSKDVILSEERDFVLTIYDDMNVEATFAKPEDIDIVNGEIYTVRLRCSTPEAQSIEVCESATKGVSVTSTSLMEIVENGSSRTVEKFGEYGFYKVTTVVSIDDGLDLKFTENPRIVYDNEVLGNVQFKGSKYVNSFINTRLNMYKVTFLDTDGKTVLSENWLQKGTVPTEIPLTVTLPAENDEYVFLNGGWTPEVSANTEDVVYEARVDSIMKDLNAYIAVKYKYGGEVTVETNSKCVDIEKQFLGLGEKTFRYSTNKWSDGTEGLSLTEGTYDFAFRVKIILDQCNDMYARSLRYFGTKKVYYFLDGSFVDDGTWLYVGENASSTTGSNISYSFTVVSSYAVTFFDDKGVQVGDVVTVASGMAVGAPAEPAKREGYTFAGWFQKDAETAYDFSAAVNEDLELYGKWTINKYEIAVAANDSKMGSVKGAGTYEYGTEVELVATAAEGYKFSNWEDDVKASATRKVKVTAAASYKANFEKIPESSSSSAKEDKSSSSTKP
ncbi:MAG: InlB B-repeat-containing protein, partial [Fibrobacter sp.]|nr:InlB B-repeat-containing protein [Fibrobacter sp.]